MTKKEAYEIIEREIKWCSDDTNRTMPEDWHKGFIQGLFQAKRLIKEAREL